MIDDDDKRKKLTGLKSVRDDEEVIPSQTKEDRPELAHEEPPTEYPSDSTSRS